MATGNLFRTDLYRIHNIVQNSMLSFPKDLLIETLREFFSQDSQFHYVKDQWGFPKTPDHTDLAPEAGLQDDVTTRLFIGEAFPYDMRYYPAILVRGGSFRYVPISISRNEELVQYRSLRITDGYNVTYSSVPNCFVLSGAWEGQLSIDILTNDLQSRDAITELVAAMIEIVHYRTFKHAGVFFRPINGGSPAESEDNNGKIYKQTITCDVRTEWRKEVPIDTIIDSINFCVDFGNLSNTPAQIAPNIRVNTTIELIETIQNL